jgi:hypothetical protein
MPRPLTALCLAGGVLVSIAPAGADDAQVRAVALVRKLGGTGRVGTVVVP